MDAKTKDEISNLAKIRTEHIVDASASKIEKLWYEQDFAKCPDFKLFQIKDNKLYSCFNEIFPDYETRLETGKFHVLSVLKRYRIPDMQFIYYDGDVLNTDDPVFVSSCLMNRSQTLIPDFSFGFFPESHLHDHANEIEELLTFAEETGKDLETWKNRTTQILYRGSLNNAYRKQYADLDGTGICNFKHVQTFHAPRGEPNYKIDDMSIACSRKDKANFKYLLHLNGGEDTAYSCAFRYGLACKSLVFYATGHPCQEWWQHNSIFRKGDHYVEVGTPQELLESINYYRNNDEEAFKIASNAHQFSSKFFTRESYLYYYYQVLLEFAKKQNSDISLLPESKLITTYKKRVDGEIKEMLPV